MDIPNWALAAISVVGSSISAYVGIRIATAQLQVNMATLQAEVMRLRDKQHANSDHIQWAVTSLEVLLRNADIDLPSPRKR